MTDDAPHTRSAPEAASPLVLGMRVDAVEFDDAVQVISRWAARHQPTGSRMVCAANVHMVMEAYDDAGYRAVVNGADLVVPDGQPLVWALRWLGVPQRHRVRVSPDLLLRLFTDAERSGSAVGLYGGSDETLPPFKTSLARHFPRLRVPFAWAPPFRALTPEEDEEVVGRICAADVQLLLVGLGCPKQELWMGEHTGRLSCAMIGVGAAFDLFAGRAKEAPHWTRDIGLEWAWRLMQEPRRLWRRHAKHDPRFLVLLAWQVLGRVRGRQSDRSL